MGTDCDTGWPSRGTPSLTFQLREQQESGPLRALVWQIPDFDPFARSEAVVLVHGYNNCFGQAIGAYDAFRDRQYTDTQLDIPQLEAAFVDMFWPGDAGGWASVFHYATDIGIAIQAAPRLAAHLSSLPNLRKVHFIGHSLGCRLILEVLEILRTTSPLAVGKVCLMAAAVPRSKVAPGGVLRAAIELPEEVLVLYSTDDSVLELVPIGEAIAGDSGESPDPALGREPPPLPPNVRAVQVAGAGHSDYWPSTDTPDEEASLRASLLVSTFFGLGSLLPRPIPLSRVAGTTMRTDVRSLPADRQIKSRNV